MDKSEVIQSLLETMLGMALGAVILCFANLIWLDMTYSKNTIKVAGTDYVREMTRWSGHKHIVNIPVYKG